MSTYLWMCVMRSLTSCSSSYSCGFPDSLMNRAPSSSPIGMMSCSSVVSIWQYSWIFPSVSYTQNCCLSLYICS